MTDHDDRAAQIEAVKAALYAEDIHVWPKEGEDPNAYQDRYWRHLAAAALDAMEPWGLDAKLDSVVAEWGDVELYMDALLIPGPWCCRIDESHIGQGRKASDALRNAVAAARKETER